jgi:hypothetical protein
MPFGFSNHFCTYTAFAAEIVEAVSPTDIRFEMSQFLDAGSPAFKNECEREE